MAKGADLLISEATFLNKDLGRAEEYLHMTAREAGELANQAGVQKLVLLHFSHRYKDFKEIREEAKEVFPNTICAEDLMRFRL